MTFNDILKSSFMENATALSVVDILIAMSLSLVLGLFVMAVYKKTFKGVMYSHSFSVSLLAMTLITTLIILAITSNVILSLGMVGALSIVRFRSAIKEPLDIAFLFWSISIGIISGAGLISLAVFGSVFVGIIMVLFINKDSNDSPYILVINCDDEHSERSSMKMLEGKVKRYVLKSKTVSKNGVEVTIEVRLKDMATPFINELCAIAGVKNAVLVSYNGDYMG